MENHDTFNPGNVLEIENWIIVGLAMWKMFTFFGPAFLIFFGWYYIDKTFSRKNQNEKI